MAKNVRRLFGEGVLSAWMAGLAVVGSWSAGCTGDQELADEPADPATKARIEQLTAEMADVPGELVVTRSTGPSLDEETRATLAGAAKVIHVYSDGHVAGYLGQARDIPGEPAPRLYFLEHGGDIVVGPSEQLPDYVLQREEQLHGVRVDNAVGLTMGHGDLWRDSTIGYEIHSSFSMRSTASSHGSQCWDRSGRAISGTAPRTPWRCRTSSKLRGGIGATSTASPPTPWAAT